MYVAVKGGERAIAQAHALLAREGRGDPALPAIAPDAVAGQLGVLVSRVMNEGSLSDPALAARAILQAQGDVLEAVTLLRSYRTTLPRFGTTEPLETAELPPQRRISATFKDIPGGQQLGATFDYTHRLFSEAGSPQGAEAPDARAELGTETDAGADVDADAGADQGAAEMPRISDILGEDALLEPASSADSADPEPGDLTRDPVSYPMTRAERLQGLARGDEGFLLSLGYSTQRGFGRNHPFAGEIRVGEVEVEIVPPELGFPVVLGRLEITECQMINQFTGSAETPAQFTRGYGLSFGRSERKAMSMSLVDRALRADEFDERRVAPAQDEEFVLSHADNVEATGFVEHLKLPHYVDFQAELGLVRRMRAEALDRRAAAARGEVDPAPSDFDREDDLLAATPEELDE
ncbi:carbon-phosphorus lyase complex subunit PhnI [Brachybacterium sp. ACRRE]|uniref:carbon-phosphorus lyase complex subunit PhnI n=1 Tax=Brachybacterium sp. ACRRE TaxID=2918184 RepID=UPI001EF174F3|nr:carbon-phosphorus lyase complex subunit PhnI [Brachybacterium sp. ACRRE]MCG7309826.1 carbon-phosphorus lyase complex subunit PhnI [Brachybacterium sp. ACRRE]